VASNFTPFRPELVLSNYNDIRTASRCDLLVADEMICITRTGVSDQRMQAHRLTFAGEGDCNFYNDTNCASHGLPATLLPPAFRQPPVARTSRGQLLASSDQLFGLCLRRRFGRAEGSAKATTRSSRVNSRLACRHKATDDVFDAVNLINGCGEAFPLPRWAGCRRRKSTGLTRRRICRGGTNIGVLITNCSLLCPDGNGAIVGRDRPHRPGRSV
jgi:hypothetical protein